MDVDSQRTIRRSLLAAGWPRRMRCTANDNDDEHAMPVANVAASRHSIAPLTGTRALVFFVFGVIVVGGGGGGSSGERHSESVHEQTLAAASNRTIERSFVNVSINGRGEREYISNACEVLQTAAKW